MPLPAHPTSLAEIEEQTPGATNLIKAMRRLDPDGIPFEVIDQTPQRARAAEYLLTLGLVETFEDPLIGGTRYKTNEAAIAALEDKN